MSRALLALTFTLLALIAAGCSEPAADSRSDQGSRGGRQAVIDPTPEPVQLDPDPEPNTQQNQEEEKVAETDDFHKDPLIQEALKVFKGRLIS